MADCLLTRSTALQQSEDDIIEENDVDDDDDLPDIVIVSLLVVKWRMRKMFPGGNCCQHLGSCLGLNIHILFLFLVNNRTLTTQSHKKKQRHTLNCWEIDTHQNIKLFQI